jgi:metallophosphoesterase superfamily enzyme
VAEITPIYGGCALRYKETLFISDIHIGQEAVFGLPSITDYLAEKIRKLGKEKKLVILGDIKETMWGFTPFERREIGEFFDVLFEKFDEISIVPGNHDGNIHKILPKKVEIISKEIKIGEYVFSHGHMHVNKDVKKLVIGHGHPVIVFTTNFSSGALHSVEPVWVQAQAKPSKRYPHLEEITIIPAFNPFAGGYGINTEKRILGPFNRYIDLQNSKLYLLDGICIDYESIRT